MQGSFKQLVSSIEPKSPILEGSFKEKQKRKSKNQKFVFFSEGRKFLLCSLKRKSFLQPVFLD